MIVTTYSEARANLARLMDQAAADAVEVRITRRGKPDMVLLAAEELEALRETAYLLRSPANAERLLASLGNARAGRNVRAMTLDELRRDVGLDAEPVPATRKPSADKAAASRRKGRRGASHSARR